jgi:hypothetical protein
MAMNLGYLNQLLEGERKYFDRGPAGRIIQPKVLSSHIKPVKSQQVLLNITCTQFHGLFTSQVHKTVGSSHPRVAGNDVLIMSEHQHRTSLMDSAQHI